MGLLSGTQTINKISPLQFAYGRCISLATGEIKLPSLQSNTISPDCVRYTEYWMVIIKWNWIISSHSQTGGMHRHSQKLMKQYSKAVALRVTDRLNSLRYDIMKASMCWLFSGRNWGSCSNFDELSTLSHRLYEFKCWTRLAAIFHVIILRLKGREMYL